jgi:asparagine N-glycosylation enzyme membrane subunit Stt3
MQDIEFEETKTVVQHTYRDLYFNGNFWHNDLIASTTTILNSSAISDMKFVICFIRRSTLDSFPVFKSVVIASVAMLLFWSEIKLSISMLQLVTDVGCIIATCKVLKPHSIKITKLKFNQGKYYENI